MSPLEGEEEGVEEEGGREDEGDKVGDLVFRWLVGDGDEALPEPCGDGAAFGVGLGVGAAVMKLRRAVKMIARTTNWRVMLDYFYLLK